MHLWGHWKPNKIYFKNHLMTSLLRFDPSSKPFEDFFWTWGLFDENVLKNEWLKKSTLKDIL